MTKMVEKEAVVWRQYPEYPFIEANQFGQVRIRDRIATRKDGRKLLIKGRTLKQYLGTGGYLYVAFGMNGKTIHLSVHRIIASSFLPNPNHLPEVNHIDCNRTNNVVSNLEWCTSKYNNQYREKHGKAFGRPLFAVNLKTFEVLHFKSQAEAGRKLGISRQSINRVLKGKRKTIGGYWFTEDKSEITKEKIQEIKANMYFFGGVIAVNLETKKALRFETQIKAERQLGVNHSHIIGVIKGQRKQTGGYWFCNADENAVEKVRAKFGDEVANEVERLMSEANE